MMKKIFFVLLGVFFFGMLAFMGPTTAAAQMSEPDQRQPNLGRDLNQQQPESGYEEQEEGRGAAPSNMGVTLTKGKLSGEVVNIDKQTGRIEIKTKEGVINSFNVDENTKSQLGNLKKGDQVDLVMVLRAEQPNQSMTR